jgi:hypothetical protein
MILSEITENCLLSIEKKMLNKYGMSTNECLTQFKKRFLFLINFNFLFPQEDLYIKRHCQQEPFCISSNHHGTNFFGFLLRANFDQIF